MVKKGTQSRSKSLSVDAKRADSHGEVAHKSSKKRTRSDIIEASSSKRGASRNSKIVEKKGVQIVEDESKAIELTSGVNTPKPNRRLTDFIFYNANGIHQPFEMIQVEDIFIAGTVLPLEETSEREKEPGIRCDGFGRVEDWAISGYEDGEPVIWVSTTIADYECVKPANPYKKLYSQFYEKARTCIEVYKRLSKPAGGNPDLTLDELLAAVLRSMSGSKNFPSGAPIKELIVSWGEFIYKELSGLEGENFKELPVLAALRDESKKRCANLLSKENTPSGGDQNKDLHDKDGEELSESTKSTGEEEEDESTKLARLLHENENWKSLRQKKRQQPVNSFTKFYIKINEAELANDYPLPAFYESSTAETDEYIICDDSMDIDDPDHLPRSMLHNWALYNSDSRLISLELLPMRPCDDIDVAIFGSGIMTTDDGSGFCLDDAEASNSSTTSSGAPGADGIPVYLSAIKEWMIEFGSLMVFISIRTDLSW